MFDSVVGYTKVQNSTGDTEGPLEGAIKGSATLLKVKRDDPGVFRVRLKESDAIQCSIILLFGIVITVFKLSVCLILGVKKILIFRA